MQQPWHSSVAPLDSAPLPLVPRASKWAPDSNSRRYHLGVLLGRSGDKTGARRELERVAGDRSDAARAERARDALRSL